MHGIRVKKSAKKYIPNPFNERIPITSTKKEKMRIKIPVGCEANEIPAKIPKRKWVTYLSFLEST